MLLAIDPRYVECLGRSIDQQHSGGGNLQGKANPKNAASGADVDDRQFRCAIVKPTSIADRLRNLFDGGVTSSHVSRGDDEIQGVFQQCLSFGSWNENARVHGKRATIKLSRPNEIGNRLTIQSALE